MSVDYSAFTSPDERIREPRKFEELKNDENFVAYLARHVVEKTKDKGDAACLADQILKLSQNDTAFATRISSKIKEFKSPIEGKILSQANAIIRSSAVLKPTDYYVNKEAVRAPRNIRSSKIYIRRGTRSIIPQEKAALYNPMLSKMTAFLAGDRKIVFEGPEAEMLLFLQGKTGLHDLPITKDTCEEYLAAAKLWDHARVAENARSHRNESFAVSSYAARTRIAQVGKLSTVQVYTKTLDPKNYENWKFLETQSNWIPERAKLHAKIVETNMVKALALSRRLNTELPSVWAVRGNTGSGKTYSIAKDSEFERSLDENRMPSGAINPDTIKGLLKQQTPELSHEQLHMEGSALTFQYADALGNEAVHATMIIDMRLASKSQVDEEVIGRASKRQGEAMLMDIDTPLLTSINRVLVRSSQGDDPVVPLAAIRQGYEAVRNERAEILKKVKESDVVTYYKFYITDDNGVQALAAKKENGRFEVVAGMEDAVSKALEKPADGEVDALVDQVIDKAYVQKALIRDHIPKAKIAMIERWEGYTVRQALEMHARGEGPLL